MFSLENLCIQTINQNISSAADFFEQSPLPWKLTRKIIRRYSAQKWQAMLDRALCADNLNYTGIKFIRCDKTIRDNLKNTILSSDDWSYIFEEEESEYCVWVNYYRIDCYKMRVCRSCFEIIKDVHKLRNKCLLVVHDHFHEVYESADIIHQIYQNSRYWCQSCFSSFLFETRDYDSCVRKLHIRPTNNRFMTDSDVDTDPSDF